MPLLLAIFIIILVTFGVSSTVWGIVGLLRLVTSPFSKKPALNSPEQIQVLEVAAIIPAHNEQRVIARTIEPLLKILPAQNIHVISDGSKDKTAEIARSYGVNVLEFAQGHGKAGALDEGIKHFRLTKKFKAVLLVDADSAVSETYLKYALPEFNDPQVAAVAVHATTDWPKNASFRQMISVSYREKFYFFLQRIIKYGQSWKYTNVIHIVPGFASIYRSSVIEKINIDPKGLVIEDFNMTFELHHKNLGKIVYHPKIYAKTQDPDNITDYVKQLRRWYLGFWQTIFRHGFWISFFWVSLLLVIVEVVISSVVFITLPFSLIYILIFHGTHIFYLTLIGVFFGLIVPDYLMTVIIAISQRRPKYLLYGLTFMYMRYIDALCMIWSIPKAVFQKSSGRWVSPTRR